MTQPKPYVVFVDDDPRLLNGLERSLSLSGPDWEFGFFDSGDAVLQAQTERRPDVMVTDLAMPGMNGIELVRSTNQRSPGTQCIVLTGTADLRIAADLINTARVFRFYTKPCAVEEIVEGIDSALRAAATGDAKADTTEVTRAADSGWVGDVLNSISSAVIVLGDARQVIYVNSNAAALLAQRDALWIDEHNRLRSKDSRLAAALARGPAEDGKGAEEDAPPFFRLSSAAGEEINAIALPATGDTGGAGARTVLFLTGAGLSDGPSRDFIAQLFGLTRTEARLVEQLVLGKRIEEAAEVLGVTLSSCRTYLKRIFSKTNTSRQVELVRKVLLATPR